ncbi:MAG TPA: HupE/UreJ family protein [Steroidobacteraceae bacterium]|nr:HupE/UreJ family protein [Steroidobacteraceae bacterium]
MRFVRAIVAALLCAAFAPLAHAHKASDAYLFLASGDAATTLRIDVALRDLDVALDVDADGDGKLTWKEVRTAWPAIETYLRQRVTLEGCPLEPESRALERRVDGTYAALTLRSRCTPALAPAIRYDVMAEVDPTHRGIVRVAWRGTTALQILVPGVRSATASIDSSSASAQPARGPGLSFVREGIHHIATGYDHVLFLICLLLPSVLRPTKQGWRPVDTFMEALLPVVGIVTSFTVAHSITLGLAAMDIVSISPAIIEPAIAFTIVLAALGNFWPVFHGRRAIVTFCFGLVHGFGFAGVLKELALPRGEFAWALFQFNLGIEIGQLLIVAAATLLLFSLRGLRAYPPLVLRGGSALAMAIAALWFVERVANLSLL